MLWFWPWFQLQSRISTLFGTYSNSDSGSGSRKKWIHISYRTAIEVLRFHPPGSGSRVGFLAFWWFGFRICGLNELVSESGQKFELSGTPFRPRWGRPLRTHFMFATTPHVVHGLCRDWQCSNWRIAYIAGFYYLPAFTKKFSNFKAICMKLVTLMRHN